MDIVYCLLPVIWWIKMFIKCVEKAINGCARTDVRHILAKVTPTQFVRSVVSLDPRQRQSVDRSERATVWATFNIVARELSEQQDSRDNSHAVEIKKSESTTTSHDVNEMKVACRHRPLRSRADSARRGQQCNKWITMLDRTRRRCSPLTSATDTEL